MCTIHRERGVLLRREEKRSQAATTTTTLAASGIGGDGSHVLDSADPHASTGKRTESALSTRTGGLGAGTTSGPELNVKGSDANLLATNSNILGSQHSSVWGGLVTISLDLHSTSDTGDGFLAREISDMDESIVEGREDMGDTENKLALSDLGTKRDGGFFSGCSLSLGWLLRWVLHPSAF